MNEIKGPPGYSKLIILIIKNKIERNITRINKIPWYQRVS